MRGVALGAVLVALAVASARAGDEVVHLRDGTRLIGRVLHLSADSLVVETSFGGRLAVPRPMIAQIVFAGEEAPGPIPEALPGPAEGTTGTLDLIIDGSAFVSTVRYRRAAERPEAVHANTIYVRIYADGALVHEEQDSTVERTVQAEGWTRLRNEHRFASYRVALPAGEREVRVFLGNDPPASFPLEGNTLQGLEVNLGTLEVGAGQVVRARLRAVRSWLGLGGFRLEPEG